MRSIMKKLGIVNKTIMVMCFVVAFGMLSSANATSIGISLVHWKGFFNLEVLNQTSGCLYSTR